MKQLPALRVERLLSLKSLNKGNEIGLTVQTEGNPPLTLAFQTALLESQLPFLTEAISQANKEAGDEVEEAHAVAVSAVVDWPNDRSSVRIHFQLKGGAVFRVELSPNGASAVIEGLKQALGDESQKPSAAPFH